MFICYQDQPKILTRVQGLMNFYRMLYSLYKSLFAGTVAPRLLHTPSREKRRFLNLNHLTKEFLEQMIPHLKALIQGVHNFQKNWPWHHFEAGYAPLTEKALLLLELVWSLSRQKFFQFQYCYQTARYRAIFGGIKLFPTSTGFKMASC